MKLCLIGVILVMLVSGCGGGGGGKSIFDDSTAVNSRLGSVIAGDRAYSPDGSRYSAIVTGKQGIGLYQKDDQFILNLAGSASVAKGIAWSRDSATIVVMQHTAEGNWLYFYSSQDGLLTRTVGSDQLPSTGYFHFIVFSRDGTEILLSYKGDKPDYRFPL